MMIVSFLGNEETAKVVRNAEEAELD